MSNSLKDSVVSGQAALPKSRVGYNRFLLLVAGLGGLLYGVDVGIIAGALPYGTMFFMFAGFTMIYLVTATFFLPETKEKTLEEIEEHFEGGK